jgi:D-aspartate ligase
VIAIIRGAHDAAPDLAGARPAARRAARDAARVPARDRPPAAELRRLRHDRLIRGGAGLPPAIVLGATTNGLAFARSLGRRGVAVLVLDSDRERPALASRFATPVLLPDVCARPDAWLATLRDLAARAASPPVLIATGDEHVLLLAAHRSELQDRFRFRIPPGDLVETLCDKRRQYERLHAAGCRLPRTALVADDEHDAGALAAQTTGFPCVVKPIFSHRWLRRGSGVKLGVAHDADDVRRLHRTMTADGGGVLLQELIPGGDDGLHGYLAYLGADARPLGALTKRKLRQHPPGFGNGSLQESTDDPAVAERSAALLHALGYQGLVAIEYKRDPRDGRDVLIEINPRSVSGTQLAIDAGVDLPWIGYADAAGLPPAPAPVGRAGVKYLHLGWDLQAFRARPDLGWAAWLGSLRGVRSHALLDVRDPRPLARYATGALRGALPRALRRNRSPVS